MLAGMALARIQKKPLRNVDFRAPVLHSLLNLITGVNIQRHEAAQPANASPARSKGDMSVNSYNRTDFQTPVRQNLSAGAQLRPLERERLRIVSSDSLFEGEHEIGIEHQGSLYRLKITRQGKLILNK